MHSQGECHSSGMSNAISDCPLSSPPLLTNLKKFVKSKLYPTLFAPMCPTSAIQTFL